jgi:hypothetical protein
VRVVHELEIDAPAAVVWSVVADLARYPEWNPFVVACTSTLVPGDAIHMRVRVLPWLAQPQTERVFEHVPGARLRYGLPPLPLGVLASDRAHAVHALGASRTRYVSRFELRGWLAPVVAALLGRRLRAGFDAMTRALAARAESLARDRVA